MAEFDINNYEDWIRIARYESRDICRRRPHLDREDMEGEMLLQMVRWPMDAPGGLIRRARNAGIDWLRKNVADSRRSNSEHTKREVAINQPLDLADQVPGTEVTFSDTLEADPIDVDGDMNVALVVDGLDDRESLVADLLSQGMNQKDIAGVLEISAATVSTLVQRKIAPRVTCGEFGVSLAPSARSGKVES